LITEETSRGRITMILRLYKENPKEEIGMIKKSKLPSKITLLMMKKEKRRGWILKFIVLETPLVSPFDPIFI
jgi:hypothetical protein